LICSVRIEPRPYPISAVTLGTLDLSIVIPAYNEAARLPATLRALNAFLMNHPWRVEVLVVDDGSTDETVGAATREQVVSASVRVVSLGVNQGKGSAIKRGVSEARGAYIALVDADLPYDLRGLDLAMDLLAAGADLVIGARDLPESSEVAGYTRMRRLSGEIYSWLVNVLAVDAIPDTQCGFKLFSAAAAKQIFERVTVKGFAFDVEALVLAQCWRLCIRRIPVTLTHSHDSKVRLVLDSIRMFLDLVRINRRRARGFYDSPRVKDGLPTR
jgi:dolichyl-phosphate beta-glucosyltransferase